MADREHLEKLKTCELLGQVDEWNKWRNENPAILPDLSGAKLRRCELPGADLTWTNLSGAKLRLANLKGADLRWANLRSAELIGADLRRADLSGASMSGANLRVAQLSEAKLNWTDLSSADLTRADLRDTYMNKVTAVEACFEEARLLRFRTADCALAGTTCSRADFSEYHREPEWHTFNGTEFEELYGQFNGVEMLFEPNANLYAIGVLIEVLCQRWVTEHDGRLPGVERLEYTRFGSKVSMRTPHGEQAESAQTLRRYLEEIMRTSSLPEPERTTAIARIGADALLWRTLNERLPLLGPFVTVSIKDGDAAVTTRQINNLSVVGTLPAEKRGSPMKVTINAKHIQNQWNVETLSMVKAAHDEDSIRAALELWAQQWEQQQEAEREATAQAIAQAIPQDKLDFWRNALANLIGSAGGGAVLAAAALLKGYLGG